MPGAGQTDCDVFVSYARRDREIVRRLAELLKAERLSVFWDQDAIAGENWRHLIEGRLRGARCVIAVWSQNSVNSDWVKREAAGGLDRGILVPISIDGSLPPKVFDQIQSEDLRNWSGSPADPRFQRMLYGVKRAIENPSRPGSTSIAYMGRRNSNNAAWRIGAGLLGAALFAGGSFGLYKVMEPRPVIYVDKPVVVEKQVVVEKPVYIDRPVAAQPERPPPFTDKQLEYDDCAFVLEAVKTCEDLSSCSSNAMRGNFSGSELRRIESMSGRSVFTSAKFFEQCETTCRRKSYSLQPTRRIVCGY